MGQAKVKLDDIVVIVVEVEVKAMVEVEVQLLLRVGGWSDKTKLILISNLVEVELGKNQKNQNNNSLNQNINMVGLMDNFIIKNHLFCLS